MSLTLDQVKQQAQAVYYIAVSATGPVDFGGIKAAIGRLPNDSSLVHSEAMYKRIAFELHGNLELQKQQIEEMMKRNRKLRDLFAAAFRRERDKRLRRKKFQFE